MDWMMIRSRISQQFDRYKYVLLIIGVGILLMLLPTQSEAKPASNTSVQNQETVPVEERLEQILSQIRGVGKVQVLITEQTGSETIYQVDEDRTEGDGSLRKKSETVIVSGGGTQEGLVQTVTPPTYLGAIIVCQGAGSPEVRLAVTNAVSAVTGIGMDRISVLEMK